MGFEVLTTRWDLCLDPKIYNHLIHFDWCYIKRHMWSQWRYGCLVAEGGHGHMVSISPWSRWSITSHWRLFCFFSICLWSMHIYQAGNIHFTGLFVFINSSCQKKIQLFTRFIVLFCTYYIQWMETLEKNNSIDHYQILGCKCIEHFYLSHERELFVWFRTRVLGTS